MTAPAHAFLPPSGAAAWIRCAAWPMMNARYPQPATQDTLEGEAAHWAFFEMLYARPVALGQVAPNGVTLLDEMIEAAELYCDVIDADLAAVGLDRRWLMVERRVHMPSISPENWGTPDTYFYAEHLRRLFVYDFKYGHKFVDAFENWQCVDYTAGIIDGLGLDGLQDQALGVDVVVIQPRNYDRAGPVRRWKVSGAQLRGHFNLLRSAAEDALSPTPDYLVGDQCEYCPGRHACNALQRAGYAAAEVSQKSIPVELPPGPLTLELRMLRRYQKALDARISGLEQEVEARIRTRGERMPGYALQDTYGREAWTAPAETIIALGAALGANVAKPAVLTPKQAIKAGMNADVVKAYTAQNRTGVKLVEDDGSAARKVFGITS